MAKRKHLIGLSDIKAVVLTCNECGSSANLALTKGTRFPRGCPGCGRDWNRTDSQTGFSASIDEYMNRHRSLQNALSGEFSSNLAYKVSLEVDIGETSESS